MRLTQRQTIFLIWEKRDGLHTSTFFSSTWVWLHSVSRRKTRSATPTIYVIYRIAKEWDGRRFQETTQNKKSFFFLFLKGKVTATWKDCILCNGRKNDIDMVADQLAATTDVPSDETANWSAVTNAVESTNLTTIMCAHKPAISATDPATNFAANGETLWWYRSGCFSQLWSICQWWSKMLGQ